MSLPTTTRKQVREQIATDLAALLTQAQAVYAYQKSDFEHLNPVVRVMSGGTLTTPQDLAGGYGVAYFFTIQIWALRFNQKSGWTEQEAEDLVDALARKIDEYITGDHAGKPWSDLTNTDRSTVSAAGNEAAGELFIVEDIPIRVDVWGDEE